MLHSRTSHKEPDQTLINGPSGAVGPKAPVDILDMEAGSTRLDRIRFNPTRLH